MSLLLSCEIVSFVRFCTSLCSLAGRVELLPLLEEPVFCSSYRFTHDRCSALSAFSQGIMCFVSVCRAFVYAFGTEIFHFERSCVCLFTWLLDLLDELLLLFLVLILFDMKNLCWVLSMHSSWERLRTNGGHPWMMSD